MIAFGETAKNAFDSVSEKAGEKVDEIKKDNAKKPTTGSSLLDLLTPAVPETDATKPKLAKPDQPPPAP